MSTLSPPVARPGRRRRWWQTAIIRLFAVVISLGLIVGAGAAAWYYLIRDAPNSGAIPGCTTVPTGPASGSPAPSPAPSVAPAAAPASPGPSFLPATPAPAAGLVVRVFNGSGRQGLARAVADEMVLRGFMVASVANDPLGEAVLEPAQIRFGPLGAAQALTVAAQIEGSVPVLDTRSDAVVDLVMGQSYNVMRTPEAAAAAATPVAGVAPSITCTPR